MVPGPRAPGPGAAHRLAALVSAPVAVPTPTTALASWLLHALAEELALSTAGPVGVTLMAPGGSPPPADWCCTAEDGSQGMAWVRISRRYPSSRFPFTDSDPRRCPGAWAAEVELGSYRCVHTLDDEGRPPTPEQVTEDALNLDSDAQAMQAAVCRLRWQYVLGPWTTLGPSGGVVGGAQLVTVALERGPIGKELP